MASSDSDSDMESRQKKIEKMVAAHQDSSGDDDNKMNIFKKRLVVDSSDESDNRMKKPSKSMSMPKTSASKIGLESSDDDYSLSKVKNELERKSPKKPMYTDSDSDMEDNKYNKSSAVAVLVKNQKKKAREVKDLVSSSSESEKDISSAVQRLEKMEKERKASTANDRKSSSNSRKKNSASSSRPKTSSGSRSIQGIKLEPVSSDSEEDTKPQIKSKPVTVDEKVDSKKIDKSKISNELKTDKDTTKIKTEKPELDEKKPKKHHSNSSRSKDKEKDKDLGEKMAKIFGTSSEDESTVRASKPPTPITTTSKPPMSSLNKNTKVAKLKVEHAFSDSNSDMDISNSMRETLSKTEKMLDSPKTDKPMPDSPALMSDSDDNELSRPPTPTFKTKNPEVVPAVVVTAEPQPETKEPKETPTEKLESKESKESKPKKEKSRHHSGGSKERKPSRDDLFNFSEDPAMAEVKKKKKKEKEKDRSRRSSAHERQKESESLFDSLLTVNVDLPARTGSKKSPGSLKSPGGVLLKSPGGSMLKSPVAALRSPGLSKSPSSSKSPVESQKSPISHRSPMISPGAKPTYLLAHAFDKSSRDAEKIHRAQELSMKDQDRSHKEKEKQSKVVEKAPKEVKTAAKENSGSMLVKEVAKEKSNSESSQQEVSLAVKEISRDKQESELNIQPKERLNEMSINKSKSLDGSSKTNVVKMEKEMTHQSKKENSISEDDLKVAAPIQKPSPKEEIKKEIAKASPKEESKKEPSKPSTKEEPKVEVSKLLSKEESRKETKDAAKESKTISSFKAAQEMVSTQKDISCLATPITVDINLKQKPEKEKISKESPKEKQCHDVQPDKKVLETSGMKDHESETSQKCLQTPSESVNQDIDTKKEEPSESGRNLAQPSLVDDKLVEKIAESTEAPNLSTSSIESMKPSNDSIESPKSPNKSIDEKIENTSVLDQEPHSESDKEQVKDDNLLPIQGSDSKVSPQLCSPGYASFASETRFEAASSPTPSSDLDEDRLVIPDVIAEETDEEDKSSKEDVSSETVANKSTDAITPVRKSTDSEESEPEKVITEMVSSAIGSEPINPETNVKTLDIVKQSEASAEEQMKNQQEQLEKSIASITGEMDPVKPLTIVTELDQNIPPVIEELLPEPEPVNKRTVISQEETESAVNALLGESFDSFETEELALQVPPTVEVMDEEENIVAVDDEAASAVAGLGFEMSPDNM